MKSFKRKILRDTQSPMNRNIWCLDLECRHEPWETVGGPQLKRKPKVGMMVECRVCHAHDIISKSRS